MKALFTTILLMSFCFNFSAQNWASIGATWFYSQETTNPSIESYTKIESIKDTLIMSTPCKLLIKYDTYFNGSFLSQYSLYMYSDLNNKVYYYKEDSSRFCLLYDFNAVAGDTVILDCELSAATGNALNIFIDSTGTESINGQTHKVLFTSDDDGLFSNFSGKVIENIGNVIYLFPTLDGGGIGPLRCYENNSLGIYNTMVTTFCDDVTGVKEVGITGVMIYPNPFRLNLNINFNNDTKLLSLKVFEITGKEVFTKKLHSPWEEINLSFLANGTYILIIQNSKEKYTTKIFKQ